MKKCKLTVARLDQITLKLKKKLKSHILSDPQRMEEFKALI